MSDLHCPYCKSDLEVCHDDGFGYEEGVKHQMECGVCGKSFVFETSIIYNYEATAADCLNDGNHFWKPTKSYPIEFSKMVCIFCGEVREPTAEEFDRIKNLTS